VLIGATAGMPPATAVNYNSWLLIGVAFNFFVFQYRKRWWQRYNYILSAALDAGMAFMGVLLYFTLSIENRNISWWGADGEHCPLASCPTARGWIWALTVSALSCDQRLPTVLMQVTAVLLQKFRLFSHSFLCFGFLFVGDVDPTKIVLPKNYYCCTNF
jgi:hypothetical protein